MKQQYTDLSVALQDPNGVAVLGFFYEVRSHAHARTHTRTHARTHTHTHTHTHARTHTRTRTHAQSGGICKKVRNNNAAFRVCSPQESRSANRKYDHLISAVQKITEASRWSLIG